MFKFLSSKRFFRTLLSLSLAAIPLWQANGQINSSRNQADISGTPNYKLYEPEGLGPHTPINDLVVDALGRLVVAAGSNLSIFDGNGWLVYHSEDPSLEQSLVIYSVVRGMNDLLYCSTNTGAFRIDLLADWKFQLVPLPNSQNIEPNRIQAYRESFNSGRFIYFYAQNAIGRFDTLTNRFEDIAPQEGIVIGSAAVHDQRLYCFGVDGTILLHIDDQNWIEIEGRTNREFKEGIRTASNWPGKYLLAGPDASGIFQLDNKELVPWPTEINSLNTHRALAIEPISQDLIAVSIDTRGVYLLNDKGDIVELLSRELDYRLGKIRKLVHAGNGTVWGAGERNIVRIDFNRPLTDFAIMMPFSLTFPRIFWYRENLYITSDEKIVRAEKFAGGALKSYRQIAPELHGIFNALPVEEGILITSQSGIHLLRDDQSLEPILDTVQTTLLIRNPEQPNLVLAAGADNYRILKREKGKWRDSGISAPSPGSSFYGLPGSDGYLWIENGVGQATRVRMSKDNLDIQTYKLGNHFSSSWVNIWDYKGRTIFTAGKDSYFVEWNTATESFDPIPEKYLQNLFGHYAGITRPSLDSFGNIWVPATAIHPVLRIQKDGTYKLDTVPLSSAQNENLMHAIPGKGGIMWLVGESSIYRYDPRKEARERFFPETKIHKFERVKSQTLSSEILENDSSPFPEISYDDNNIRIHFATPTISTTDKVWHEYRVEGYINEWTVTQTSHSIDFDNLQEGDYRVQLRAVFENGHYGQQALANFTILPPLYKSPLALTLYLVLSVALVILIAFYSRRLSERKNHRLQQLVDLRTRELGMANSELQQLVVRAESATSAKSSFLQNVSHEMRTPLNQILGPVALLLGDARNAEEKETLSIVNKAAERMLQMVEKLTSFTENAARSAPLESVTFDIHSLVEDLFQKYKPLADEKQIEFTQHIDPKMGHYWTGDVNRIRHALNILIENAFKFTERGAVAIDVAMASDTGAERSVKFEISDTGIGINAKMRNKIFEPFSQIVPSQKAKHEGTGIGLALCHQLVAALNGEIEVESIEGLGTVFRIIVPLSSNLSG